MGSVLWLVTRGLKGKGHRLEVVGYFHTQGAARSWVDEQMTIRDQIPLNERGLPYREPIAIHCLEEVKGMESDYLRGNMDDEEWGWRLESELEYDRYLDLLYEEQLEGDLIEEYDSYYAEG